MSDCDLSALERAHEHSASSIILLAKLEKLLKSESGRRLRLSADQAKQIRELPG